MAESAAGRLSEERGARQGEDMPQQGHVVAEATAAGFWRRALRHPGFVVGALLVLALVLMAGVSAFWTPYGPEDLDMEAVLESSSASHWLGTDAFGRDVASLLLLGAQASLLAGVIAVGIGLGAGLLLGLLAAARPGRVQGLIMRTADFMLAFPAILTAIMLTAVFGAGLGNAIVAVGIYNIPSFAHHARSRRWGVVARVCNGGAGMRAGAVADHVAARAAQHPSALAGAGHGALCGGDPGGGGAVVPGFRGAAAAALLGADAG